MPVDTSSANIIICICTYQTGHSSSVNSDITNIRIIISEIPSSNIIYIPIVVVINSITRNFTFIYPDPALEFRIVPTAAVIDYCDDNIRIALGDIPRGGHFHIRTNLGNLHTIYA